MSINAKGHSPVTSTRAKSSPIDVPLISRDDKKAAEVPEANDSEQLIDMQMYRSVDRRWMVRRNNL